MRVGIRHVGANLFRTARERDGVVRGDAEAVEIANIIVCLVTQVHFLAVGAAQRVVVVGVAEGGSPAVHADACAVDGCAVAVLNFRR